MFVACDAAQDAVEWVTQIISRTTSEIAPLITSLLPNE
jgi:hypothetical protein